MASTALRIMLTLLTEASKALHLTAHTSPRPCHLQLDRPSLPRSALSHLQMALSLEHPILGSLPNCLSAFKPQLIFQFLWENLLDPQPLPPFKED